MAEGLTDLDRPRLTGGQAMTTRPIIYVGLDGSWRTTGALDWALHEARLRREPIRAIHVVPEKLRHAPTIEPVLIDQFSYQLLDEVSEYLRGTADGLDHSVDLVVGHPADRLAELAAGSRMLVVGRRGAGSLTRALIGSTSEGVANRADVPVVVVPDQWQPIATNGPVLVGVGEDDEEDHVIEFALRVAAERGVRLCLVSVWQVPGIYSWDMLSSAEVDEDWTAAARKRIESIAAKWQARHPDVEIRGELRRDRTARGLVAAAGEADAQLLVIGGRHHSRIGDLLLGSVGRGVLHHATVPLAIVHQAQLPDPATGGPKVGVVEEGSR